MNNLKQLREAIVKVNKDIMKLEFGCEVIVEFENGETGPAVVVEEMAGPSFLVKWEFGTEDIEHDHLIEILGRPIRLSDVLVAMKKIETWGHGWARMPDRELAELCFGKWNLLKDDINLQEEPTISFLHSILCQKK